MPEFYEDKFFKWKIEGKVMSMIGPIAPCKLSSDDLNKMREKQKGYHASGLEKIKSLGIEIIEFWLPEEALGFYTDFYKKHGYKFEVVKKEDGTLFCRLLL